MAGVRDPAFWKRFSIAVHQDEEKANISDSNSTSSSSHNKVKREDSWLERARDKNKKARIYGWIIALSFVLVIAGIVVALLWFMKVGPFDNPDDF